MLQNHTILITKFYILIYELVTLISFLSFFLSFFFVFLELHRWHMKVPRLRVKLELQPLAYSTATIPPDLSRIWNLHHTSRQRCILNPLSKARDQTCILMDTSQIRFHWAMKGTPSHSDFSFSWLFFVTYFLHVTFITSFCSIYMITNTYIHTTVIIILLG